MSAAMDSTMKEAGPRVLDQWQAEHTSQELNGFQGILFGVVAGGLLWLGLVWFIFSVL